MFDTYSPDINEYIANLPNLIRQVEAVEADAVTINFLLSHQSKFLKGEHISEIHGLDEVRRYEKLKKKGVTENRAIELSIDPEKFFCYFCDLTALRLRHRSYW